MSELRCVLVQARLYAAKALFQLLSCVNLGYLIKHKYIVDCLQFWRNGYLYVPK